MGYSKIRLYFHKCLFCTNGSLLLPDCVLGSGLRASQQKFPWDFVTFDRRKLPLGLHMRLLWELKAWELGPLQLLWSVCSEIRPSLRLHQQLPRLQESQVVHLPPGQLYLVYGISIDPFPFRLGSILSMPWITELRAQYKHIQGRTFSVVDHRCVASLLCCHLVASITMPQTKALDATSIRPGGRAQQWQRVQYQFWQ